MKKLAVLLAIVVCAAAAATASATVSAQAGSAPVSSQVALDWNSYAVAAVRAAQTLDDVPLGGAPRALYQPEGLIYMAYVEAAVYDAVTKIDHRYRPYHHFEVGAGDASVEAAVASAAYATLVYYVGDPSGALAVHYADSIGALPADKRTARGIAVGQAAAADIEQLRAGDGLDAPTGLFGAPFVYTATNAGQWQVVPPFVAVGAQTPWVAFMRPFTLETAAQFRAPRVPSWEARSTRQTSTRRRTSAPRRASCARPTRRQSRASGTPTCRVSRTSSTVTSRSNAGWISSTRCT